MIKNKTVFSPDRVYRYTLFREWDSLFSGHKNYIMWNGLNPSVADETQNDNTVSICIEYSKNWGFGSMYMMNLFAICSTDPEGMLSAKDPVGPDNNKWLKKIASKASSIICVWGVDGGHMERDRAVLKLLKNKTLQCLKKTRDGFPHHPLYMKKVTEPRPYTGRFIG